MYPARRLLTLAIAVLVGCGSGDGSSTAAYNYRTCQSDGDCSGKTFDCEHVDGVSTGICTHQCVTDAECPPGDRCLQGEDIGLEPSCFKGCLSDVDCPAGLVCRSNNDGVMFCLPAAWVTSPPPAGTIGDPCTSDADCADGSCNGSWCTMTCSISMDCGQNSAGQENWCVTAASEQDLCFPGCYTDGDCTPYPGTTCQSTTSNTGTIEVDICSQ